MTYTIPFSQLGKNDIPTAGGKGANLCEMTQIGLNVPPGFVITTQACLFYLDNAEFSSRLGPPPIVDG